MLETTPTPARTGTTTPARVLNRGRETAAGTHAGTAAAAFAPGATAPRTSSAAGRKAARPDVRVGGVVASTVGRVCHRHRAAGPRRDVERERPLVVSRCAAVGADRRVRALTAHAHHAAGGRGVRLRRRIASTCRRSGSGRVDAGLLAADADQLELARGRHRVLVLLAQEPSLDERVDARGKGVRDVRVLESEESDRAGVLLATKDELGFFFASGFVPPDRHRDRQQDRHDDESDQQGSHGVPALGVLTA